MCYIIIAYMIVNFTLSRVVYFTTYYSWVRNSFLCSCIIIHIVFKKNVSHSHNGVDWFIYLCHNTYYIYTKPLQKEVFSENKINTMQRIVVLWMGFCWKNIIKNKMRWQLNTAIDWPKPLDKLDECWLYG